jgi:hypothetical protein
MLNNNSKSVVIFLMVLLIAAGLSCGQEGDSNEQNQSDMNHETMMDTSKMKNQHNHMDHEKMKDSEHKKMMQDDKSIVHEGVIDLAAIDENGNGKVYQDQMCWNVISDKAGECPQCGMKLKEVSLEKAKENLEENGFEVK